MNMQLPLFPLPSHILPEGILPLRIFEARYVRMIKLASQRYSGFGVVMIDSEKPGGYGAIQRIGTRVEVIDFYTLEDGLLGVTVVGKERFRINDIHVEDDGLKIADVATLPNWPSRPLDGNERALAAKLREVFNSYPDLAQLYPNPHFEDATWLCQRWLELLPMPVTEKQVLLSANSADSSLALLNQIMLHA